jgi:dUTP pyrophosphatase
MKRIAQFEKVSWERFLEDWRDTFLSEERDRAEQIGHEQLKDRLSKEAQGIYNNLTLPKRATAGSAGYDFYSPLTFTLKPGEAIKIPTGIRVRIEDGWVLKCYPRSGLGFKFRLQLNNTVGIIDSDYYGSDNEGHIFCKLTNDSNENKAVSIEEGTGFIQGIFVEYGITIDDEAMDLRNGGFGSTT